MPTYYYFEDLPETNTTNNSETWANQLSYTFTPIAGTYIVEWNLMVASSSTTTGNGPQYRVTDGTTVFVSSQTGIHATYTNGGYEERSGFSRVTLTATSKTYTIDYCRSYNNSGTIYCKNAKILFRRVA
jgi:hypothetical protein